jgi:outer membrane protein
MRRKMPSFRSFELAALGAALVMLALPAAVRAQGAAAVTKVAVVDTQRILTDSKVGRATLQRLKQLTESKQAEANAKQQEIADLRKRLEEGQLSLSEDKQSEMQKNLEDKVIAFRRFQDDTQRSLQKARDEAFQDIERRVLPIIQTVGAEGNYTLIFNKFQSGLLYAQDAVDITDTILQRFDAANPSGAASSQGTGGTQGK